MSECVYVSENVDIFICVNERAAGSGVGGVGCVPRLCVVPFINNIFTVEISAFC